MFQGQAQFVPGTIPGRSAAEKVYVLKVYVPFSLAIFSIACNLIWWAILGFQDVVKQQEIRKIKEITAKNLRKNKPKTQQKPPRFFFAVFVGHFCL